MQDRIAVNRQVFDFVKYERCRWELRAFRKFGWNGNLV